MTSEYFIGGQPMAMLERPNSQEPRVVNSRIFFITIAPSPKGLVQVYLVRIILALGACWYAGLDCMFMYTSLRYVSLPDDPNMLANA